MRLLNVQTKKLELRHDKPSYAIVSHRWGTESEEVLFTDISDLSVLKRKGRGYKKIVASCARALEDGHAYLWIDTCCIDKRNERELTTAINSMYGWYQEAEVCYAYLHDVGDISEFTKSEWFLRGWTLQELIAPRVLKFFAKDWTFLGTREDLIHLIMKCTGIKSEILVSGAIRHNVSIAQRMHWAACRVTTEEEDRAYSLLGLFDIHLPAIYGIRQKAFQELQFKIVSKSPDKSLFAWKLISDAAIDSSSSETSISGLLAPSPSQYLDAYEIPCKEFYRPFGSKRWSRWECFSVKNGAVCVTLPIRQIEETSIHEALLRCSLDPPQSSHQSQRPLVVYLKQDDKYGRFVRVHAPTSLRPLQEDSVASFALEKVYVEEVSHSTSYNPEFRRTPLPLPQNTRPVPVTVMSDVESHEHANGVAPGSRVAASPSPVPVLLRSDSGIAIAVNGSNKADENHPPIDNAMRASDAADPEGRTGVPPFRRLHFRHPPESKTVNIIVCGEPGAGTGGVVNLIAGRDIVDSQTEFKRAPMSFTTHDISLESRNMRIFYVVGPRDHLLDIGGYHTATNNVTELARSLCSDGGVHVLLCCMLRTKPNRNIHRLFYEALCAKNVPVTVLGTGFAGLGRNLQLDLAGICCDVYAGISLVRPHTPEKRVEHERSVKTVRKLLVEHTDGSLGGHLPHVGPSTYLVLQEFMSASARFQLSIELTHGLGQR